MLRTKLKIVYKILYSFLDLFRHGLVLARFFGNNRCVNWVSAFKYVFPRYTSYAIQTLLDELCASFYFGVDLLSYRFYGYFPRSKCPTFVLKHESSCPSVFLPPPPSTLPTCVRQNRLYMNPRVNY